MKITYSGFYLTCCQSLNKSVMKTSYDDHLNVYISTMNWIILSLKSLKLKNLNNINLFIVTKKQHFF